MSAVHMHEQMNKRVREYSLGMKQRLGIAMALVRRPSLLILDEPANGLDPAGIEETRALLRNLAADGITIMVSSHLLDEIDRTAGVLGILSRGRLLFQGTRDDLMRTSAPDLLIECSDPAARPRCSPPTAPLQSGVTTGPSGRRRKPALAARAARRHDPHPAPHAGCDRPCRIRPRARGHRRLRRAP